MGSVHIIGSIIFPKWFRSETISLLSFKSFRCGLCQCLFPGMMIYFLFLLLSSFEYQLSKGHQPPTVHGYITYVSSQSQSFRGGHIASWLQQSSYGTHLCYWAYWKIATDVWQLWFYLTPDSKGIGSLWQQENAISDFVCMANQIFDTTARNVFGFLKMDERFQQLLLMESPLAVLAVQFTIATLHYKIINIFFVPTMPASTWFVPLLVATCRQLPRVGLVWIWITKPPKKLIMNEDKHVSNSRSEWNVLVLHIQTMHWHLLKTKSKRMVRVIRTEKIIQRETRTTQTWSQKSKHDSAAGARIMSKLLLLHVVSFSLVPLFLVPKESAVSSYVHFFGRSQGYFNLLLGVH